LRTAITPAIWNGYARFTKKKFKLEQFLDDAAAAEFVGVEIGPGLKLGKPDTCRRNIESRGLQISAFQSNVTYNPWPPNTEEYHKAVHYASELGVSYLVVCGGFLPNQRRTTYGFDYDMYAGNLGDAIEYARKLGVTVAFHPHRGCIVETIAEAKEMLKRLPKMKFCLDVAHLEASGEDAVQFIRTFRKQIAYAHMKDYTWKLDSFVELGRGDGKLNIASCVKELKRDGYDGWLAVELDKTFAGENPRTPLESAKMCRRYLRRNCGI
jgi:sugar phosphate isomerase/epimerase